MLIVPIGKVELQVAKPAILSMNMTVEVIFLETGKNGA